MSDFHVRKRTDPERRQRPPSAVGSRRERYDGMSGNVTPIMRGSPRQQHHQSAGTPVRVEARPCPITCVRDLGVRPQRRLNLPHPRQYRTTRPNDALPRTGGRTERHLREAYASQSVRFGACRTAPALVQFSRSVRLNFKCSARSQRVYSVGRPASFQAVKPPSRCATRWYPMSCNVAAARAERPPLAQWTMTRRDGSKGSW